MKYIYTWLRRWEELGDSEIAWGLYASDGTGLRNVKTKKVVDKQ